MKPLYLFFSHYISSRFEVFFWLKNYMLIRNMKCENVAKEMNKSTNTHKLTIFFLLFIVYPFITPTQTVNDVK